MEYLDYAIMSLIVRMVYKRFIKISRSSLRGSTMKLEPTTLTLLDEIIPKDLKQWSWIFDMEFEVLFNKASALKLKTPALIC